LSGFCNAPEYGAAIKDRVYVTMMYVGLLHRSPDPVGLDYWVAQRREGRRGLLNNFIAAARNA
jgi:hypothetical protein